MSATLPTTITVPDPAPAAPAPPPASAAPALAGVAPVALRTDHYELTALDAALASGVADAAATFELFARRLPRGRRFGVVAGTDLAIDAVENFTFGDAELSYLADAGFLSAAALEYLAGYRFRGDIDGYAEGELYFPYSPVLTVSGTWAECVVLETVLLSIFNSSCAVASAAARMRIAAGERTLLDGGSRRTSDTFAPVAARAAHIGGVDLTSNLAAGAAYGVPTAGTTMHAFVLAHRTERAAFDAQVARFGADTTFLVDTYDTATGIDNALAACAAVGAAPAAVRIDSGDLAVEARAARARLDAAGANATRIIVSGDLDEYSIAKLADAPVDGFLVGTRLVTGSGHPAAGMVYKLVSIADPTDPQGPQRGVAKASAGKVSVGGRKVASRLLDDSGHAYAEHVVARAVPPTQLADGPFSRHLQVPLVRRGERVTSGSLRAAREHCAAALAELRGNALDLSDGRAALDATPGR